jgi:hypothetical protein
MKNLIISLSLIWYIPFTINGQVNFSKVSPPFIMDTKNPQLILNHPNEGTFFINDSIQVQWNATDESFGSNPISVGLSTTQSESFTIIKQNIVNTGNTYIHTGPDFSSYGKVNIVAIDTFGLTSEDYSNNYFNLILGYSKLAFSPDTCHFGPVPISSVNDTSQSVWVRNLGNKDLTINNLAELEAPFSFIFTTPVIIPPGDSVELEVTLDRSFPAAIYNDAIVFDTTSKGNNVLPVIATLYDTWPEVNLGEDITKCAVSTITLTATASGGEPPYSYIWNTGASGPYISTSTNVDSIFIVTITDQLGLQDSDTISVKIQQVYQGEEICIVTVDPASQKNIVVWEKTSGMGTEFYRIYRYEIDYQEIGTVPFDSLSVFIDNFSNPDQYNYLYKLSAVDSCGNESTLSDYHQTIRLTTSMGFPTGVTLVWNPYIGFNYYKFYIYRGSTYNDLYLIDSVNNFTFTHTDPNPPPLEIYYRIVVKKNPDSMCDPTNGKSLSGPFKQSLSNIGDGGESLTLKFRTYLEGPFQSSTMTMATHLNQSGLLPLNQPFSQPPWDYQGEEHVDQIPNLSIVDWILIELRGIYSIEPDPSQATFETSFFMKSAFLRNDGWIVDLDGSSFPTFNALIPTDSFALYAIIWHRNHLGILTNYPLTKANGTYTYNFWSNAGRVYGGVAAHKKLYDVPPQVIWGMIAGDANTDGIIDVFDKNSVWYFQAGSSGYEPSDINMDGDVNNIDKNQFWLPNIGKGSQVPE